MIKNYLKIAWRNLLKNKRATIINVLGLSFGLSIFILISLWILHGLQYDQYHKNYDSIGQIYQTQTQNGEMFTGQAVPLPLEQELKTNYADQFEHIIMASWTDDHILSAGDKHLTQTGIFMDKDAPEMLSLEFLKGNDNALAEPGSIILSSSAAKAIFGEEDPMGQLMKINQHLDVKVSGVFKDLPNNTTFQHLQFIAPWSLYVKSQPWIERNRDVWDNNSFQCFVQVAAGKSFSSVNDIVADAKQNKVSEGQKRFKAKLTIHPMSKWYLYDQWENGQVVGGQIDSIHMFAVIAVFVLLLACVNFINLSTARSQRRAKEVGIRKTVGSSRSQLIWQFLMESILIACIAFLIAVLLSALALPFFNQIVNQQITYPFFWWPFWITGLSLSIITGLLAGAYPALYLSSFQPLRVLKGSLRVGKSSSIQRKVLVTFQFTISIILVIGTWIVFQQIQHGLNREKGYEQQGLLTVQMSAPQFYGKYEVLNYRLKQEGLITALAESSSSLTSVNSNSGGFDWDGKDPNFIPDFAVNSVTHDFGETVKWNIHTGRDFSREFATDSNAVVINKALVEFTGIENPVGTVLRWGDDQFTIIGVVDDMVVSSPYRKVKQAIYFLTDENVNWIVLRINPNRPTSEVLTGLEKVFKEVIPDAAYNFQFVNDQYAHKFESEQRTAHSALLFTFFAILISALGLFGLASFVAEQRTKEIGIRKVIGASVLQLWNTLSLNFIVLTLLACLIAAPMAYMIMQSWLQQFTYKINISWWVFLLTMLGSLLMTIIVVSRQTIKVVRANPVNSLRDE